MDIHLTARERDRMVPLTFVESSTLRAIGYDSASQVLGVQFTSGAIHHYLNVPDDLWREFESALSKGSFYALNVRSKFASEKLTGECLLCGDKPGLIGEPCADCGSDVYAAECGAEGPNGVRCSKVLGHERRDDDGAAFHGRGKQTWRVE